MGYGPRSISRLLRLLMGLTFLAWATQVLLQQWAHGGTELFTSRVGVGGTLELRSEAHIFGREVRLRQIARWADADATSFEPLGDLVILHLTDDHPQDSMTIEQLKQLLTDAGVNIAPILFSGATSTTVSRTDAQPDTRVSGIGYRVSAPTPDTRYPTPDVRTLKQLLTSDLSERLQLPPDSLQIDWKNKDEKLLNLSEPLVRFAITPRRARALGNINWDITIVEGEFSKKANISAFARAWQNQLIATHPIPFKQLIRDEDIQEKRTLVDRLDDPPSLLTRPQIVGQQAAIELKTGAVLSARSVEAVPMVKLGQLVTVTITMGAVQVKTAARAMEAGSYGQSIRVRNDATRDVYEVTITGPQRATLIASSELRVPSSELRASLNSELGTRN